MSKDLSARPRRSLLYMPGSNARALEKGRTLLADGLILDLEDSVSPEHKITARQQIAAALSEGGYGLREMTIRTNGLDTEWGEDDVRAVSAMPCHAVVLPKVEQPETILRAAEIMDAAGAPADMQIWCMVETPLGILNARDMAFSHPRLGCFMMGNSDLAKDLRCRHTPDRMPFLYAMQACIVAARAAGIGILDGVHLDLNDDAGFRAQCEQGRDLGFDGKTLIHPKTIDVANEVFSPSAKDLAWAEKIAAAHAAAMAKGDGVTLVDGKLVENLHVQEAQRLVTMSEAITAMQA